METLICSLKVSDIHDIFSKYVKEDLKELCFDRSGQYVIRRILERIPEIEDIGYAVKTILPLSQKLIGDSPLSMT